MKGFEVKVLYNRYNKKKDRSVSLHFITGTEVSYEDLEPIDKNVDLMGTLVFLPDGMQRVEVPKIDSDLQEKSPSKRLRNTLFVLQKQILGREPTQDEFADYYSRAMERIIQKVKDKLDD